MWVIICILMPPILEEIMQYKMVCQYYNDDINNSLQINSVPFLKVHICIDTEIILHINYDSAPTFEV